jgi:hypothetical protein
MDTDSKVRWVTEEEMTAHVDGLIQLSEDGLASLMLAWSSHFRQYRAGVKVVYAPLVACMQSDYFFILGMTAEDTAPCGKCGGEQEVVAYRQYTGIAGGQCYSTDLACGHSNVDTSDDALAAMYK